MHRGLSRPYAIPDFPRYVNSLSLMDHQQFEYGDISHHSVRRKTWRCTPTNQSHALILSLLNSTTLGPLLQPFTCPNSSMQYTHTTENNIHFELNIYSYSYPILRVAPLISVTAPFSSTATQQLSHPPLATRQASFVSLSTSNTVNQNSDEGEPAETCPQASGARSLKAAAFICA